MKEPHSANANVAHHLDKMRAQQPEAPALILRRSGSAQTLSYAQLQTRVDKVRQLFRSRGIGAGTRTLLLVKPGGELIISVFALLGLGAVPVVIDPGMGLRSFLHCVKRTAPEALVGIPRAHLIARLFPKAFASVQSRSSIGLCNVPADTSDAVALPCVHSEAHEPAAILFTSGSTGPAKGVRYTHGIFQAQLDMIRNHYGIQAGEVDLPLLPVFALFNPALGMCTVVPEMNPARPVSVNPSRLLNAIREHEVTNSFGSPAIWTRLIRYCEHSGDRLPQLRRILMAGAAVSPTLIERARICFPNARIHTPYGATESLPLCSIDDASILEHAGHTRRGKGTCVGKPLSSVRIAIMHPQQGSVDCLTPEKLCPTGEVGEIIARAPVVTPGYDALEEATKQAKIFHEQHTDGSKQSALWHRIGDLGYLDNEGQLWFCGRKAETVHTATGPLYTDCCEGIFNTHPKVYRSALIGLGEAGKQRPALVVEPSPGAFPSNKSARATFIEELNALAQAQPHTQGIHLFFFRKRMPVDVRHNAKIHRLTLARIYSAKSPSP